MWIESGLSLLEGLDTLHMDPTAAMDRKESQSDWIQIRFPRDPSGYEGDLIGERPTGQPAGRFLF